VVVSAQLYTCRGLALSVFSFFLSLAGPKGSLRESTAAGGCVSVCCMRVFLNNEWGVELSHRLLPTVKRCTDAWWLVKVLEAYTSASNLFGNFHLYPFWSRSTPDSPSVLYTVSLPPPVFSQPFAVPPSNTPLVSSLSVSSLSQALCSFQKQLIQFFHPLHSSSWERKMISSSSLITSWTCTTEWAFSPWGCGSVDVPHQMVSGMMGCVRRRVERVNGVKPGCHSEGDGREAVSMSLSIRDTPTPHSGENKGQESVRVVQLIEDLWLSEYADLLAVIDQDPRDCFLGGECIERKKKCTRRGQWREKCTGKLGSLSFSNSPTRLYGLRQKQLLVICPGGMKSSCFFLLCSLSSLFPSFQAIWTPFARVQIPL